VRAPLPFAVTALLAALMAGCGTGLYDASGVPPPETGPGGALVCEAGLARCANACVVETTEQCGDACASCFDLVPSPPAHGAAACLAGTCGYACDFGYLKCDGGCCASSAVAAGDAFTCAVLANGEARCWGANESGQLGAGATSPSRPLPGPVALSAAASAIGAGAAHACAILASGAIECWGANGQGQVSGTSVSAMEVTPTATPVTTGATSVVAGSAHTCALLSDQTVRCWGSDSLGQLGPNSGAPAVTGATALSAGANHTCAVVAGAVKCWGDNASGQLGATPSGGLATPIGSGITRVAASAGQTCATTGVATNAAIDDVVKCWGDSLGAAFAFASPQTTPAIPMKSLDQSTIRGDDVTILAAGRRHVCYQKKTESVSCFGADNLHGQLGGAPVTAAELVQVPLIPVTVPAVGALAAGADHTCAVLGDGTLRCWGANDRGQLGIGNLVDPPVGDVVAPSGR
jgi:alpha-tubulin suppressor-like RCC1 family protein